MVTSGPSDRDGRVALPAAVDDIDGSTTIGEV